MAKRTSRYSDPEPEDDLVAEDVAGEDSADEAAADADDPRPAGSEAYRVVDAGTVIDGIEYPKHKGPPETAGIAYLPPDQAQELVNCGVKLKHILADGTDEEMVPVPKEPEPEEENQSEAQPS